MLDDVEWVRLGKSKNIVRRHIKAPGRDGHADTLCNMFWPKDNVRALREWETDLQVCGACLRTLSGRMQVRELELVS